MTLDIYEERMIKAGLATPEDFGVQSEEQPKEQVENQATDPQVDEQPQDQAEQETASDTSADEQKQPDATDEEDYISYNGEIIKANKIPKQLRQKIKNEERENKQLKETLARLQEERDQYARYYQQAQQQSQYSQTQHNYNPYEGLDPDDPIDANKIHNLQLQAQLEQLKGIVQQELTEKEKRLQQERQIAVTQHDIRIAREIDKAAEKNIPDYSTTIKSYETMRRNMLRHENQDAKPEEIEQQINLERLQAAYYAENSQEDVALFYYNYARGKVAAAREALGLQPQGSGINHRKIQENRSKHMVISGSGGSGGSARKDPGKMSMDELKAWVTEDPSGYESYVKRNPDFRKQKYNLFQ